MVSDEIDKAERRLLNACNTKKKNSEQMPGAVDEICHYVGDK